MPPPHLFGGYKGRGIRDPLKNGAQPIAVRNNFQEGLDVTRIKIRHLIGENKWESSGKLDSNGWSLKVLL